VHTRASDGAADPPEIARLAARAGVEAVVLTDHDRLSPGAGWQEGALVIPGQEVTPRHNHLLALGLDHTLPKFKGDGVNGDPARSLTLIQKRGGWAALAHPLDAAIPSSQRSRSFVTLDFSAIDCPGLELWNAMSAFKDELHGFGKFLARLAMPLSYLAGPSPVLLALWDTMGRTRPWVAFAGADAHAFSLGKRWLPVRVYSYRRHMRILLTGLWLSRPFSGDYEKDHALLLEALAQGRCFAALGQARGFACRIKGPAGEALLPGVETAYEPGWVLEAELPARGQARLLRNGRVVQKAKGRRFTWPLDKPGVWRLEARRWRFPAGWRPWIYCNPFYLREAA
jgi:hypothetical protein